MVLRVAGKPAIEIIRAEIGLEMIGDPQQLLVIATDTPIDTSILQINLDDIQTIVAVIEKQLLQ